MQATLVQTGRLLLSMLFVFSAISKLISLPFFDGMVAELFIGEDYFDHPRAMWFSQMFTRTIISSELLLGVAILQTKYLKKIILPVIQIMLLAFTAHLIYEGIKRGFVDGNCGCFGDVLPMTNLESIIKNIVAIIIGVYIWLNYLDVKEMHFGSWVKASVLGIVCLGTLLLTIKDYSPDKQELIEIEEIVPVNEEKVIESPLIDTLDTADPIAETIDPMVNKVDEKVVITEIEADKTKQTTVLTPTEITKNLLIKYAKFTDGTVMQLEKGRQLVCLFSLTCSHCQQAYKEICEISQDGELPTLYLLTYGTEYDLKFFFNLAEGCKYTYMRTENYGNFKRMLEGEDFPRILAFKDGEITKTWNTENYSEESLRIYYGIKKKIKKRNPAIDGIDVINDNASPFGGQSDNPWD